MTSKITQGPIDVSIGTVLGLIWGTILIYVPASPWAVIYNQQECEDQNIKKSQVNYYIIHLELTTRLIRYKLQYSKTERTKLNYSH